MKLVYRWYIYGEWRYAVVRVRKRGLYGTWGKHEYPCRFLTYDPTNLFRRNGMPV